MLQRFLVGLLTLVVVAACGQPESSKLGFSQPTAPGLAKVFTSADFTGTGSAGSPLALVGVTYSKSGAYGDGSDGNVTIAVNTHLARDMFYNNLTVNGGGVTLFADNWRIWVKGTLVLTGTISATGNKGSNSNGFGAAGGTAFNGSMPANGAGGQGGRNGVGAAGVNLSACLQQLTTAGGAGGTATNAGGAGGTCSAAAETNGRINAFPAAVWARWPSQPNNTISASPGGGGGGSSGAGCDAGGGGAGGGWLVVAAKSWSGAGSLVARGGDGGSPGGACAVGGSGGGRGGIITWLTSATTIPTTDVTPGTPSSPINGGGAAGAGASGLVIDLSGN